MILSVGKRWWGIWLGFITAPCVGQGSCVQLYGTIYHSFSQALVPQAQIIVKDASNQLLISTDAMKGVYQISLPCHAATLTVRAPGYRDLTLPLEAKASPPKTAFYVPLVMIPIDRQNTDQPYFQAEQSHYELSGTSSDTKKFAKRVFKITDALTHQVLEASLCLFYTQTATKRCFEVKEPLNVSFTQPDVIAFEASARGYQTYKGNLLLPQLDDKTTDYVIRLVKELTVFSLVTPDATHSYWLINETGTPLPLKTTDFTHHYAYVSEGSYQLCIGKSADELKTLERVSVRPGLNTYWLSEQVLTKITTSPVSEALSSKAIDVAEKPQHYVLYFDQSDYALSDSASRSLDTLAVWLYRQPQQKIQIVGHTDSVGDTQLNQILSEFRAKVTFNYLFEKGVSPQQMTWKGIGSRQPAAPNDTESQRRKNRRVEISLLPTSKP
ncbi:MAG: OmpA family protein [Runella sp.]